MSEGYIVINSAEANKAAKKRKVDVREAQTRADGPESVMT
jgi:hypothetical protein